MMRIEKGSVGVVEYLKNSISKELLSKFPQYNATSCSSPSGLKLDFIYSESSIWSPLVKPHLPPLRPDNYEKKKKDDKKKNLNVGFNNMVKQSSNKKMKLKKRSGDLFESSSAPLLPASNYSHSPEKKWANILKVGPKCFKKTSKKKEHPAMHISLSKCFRSSMF